MNEEDLKILKSLIHHNVIVMNPKSDYETRRQRLTRNNKKIIELYEKYSNNLKEVQKLKKVAKIDIEQVQKKKNITTREFTEIYGLGTTSQQNYRARLHDPLPYIQLGKNCKILYNVEEVEKWKVRNNITF